MKILLIESTLKSGISVFALEQNETRPIAPLNKKNPFEKGEFSDFMFTFAIYQIFLI